MKRSDNMDFSKNNIQSLYRLINKTDNISAKRAALHKMCDKCDFSSLMDKYNGDVDTLNMIKYIKKEYDDMIVASKSPYKVTEEEFKDRIIKLKQVDEIYRSTSNPYIRFDKIAKLFRNPDYMKKCYKLFILNGKNDPMLDEIRPILNNFNIYYREFRDNFKKDIGKTVFNAYKENDEMQKYKYGEFIIMEYLNVTTMDDYEKFLDKYGIDENIFNNVLQAVKIRNEDLYNIFISRKKNDDKFLRNIYMYNIDDLAYAINNGEFIYGNRFDLLEFIRLIPFKNSTDFVLELSNFMNKYNKSYNDVIMKYITDNNLYKEGALKALDIVINSKGIINGITYSKEEMNILVNYLISRDIPICKASLVEASKKYLNNQINDSVIIKKRENPIIIPKTY